MDSADITIIYEDEQIVVINKPSGVLVHEDGQAVNADMPTVVEWLLRRAPEARGVGEPGRSPQGEELESSGVVHRLDRETSGVMVLAKTHDAFTALKQQFQDRSVRKEYRAFVYGRVHERYGTVDRVIGRSAKDFRLRSAEPGAKGTLREAKIDWETIGVGEYLDEAFSYLKLKPKTGRTHQLRVHCKAIGRPIVGDTLYAKHKVIDSNNLELDRLALHAHVLEITVPGGEAERFVAPVPLAFDLAAERIAES